MKKVFKKFAKVALVFAFVFACTATAYAYNGKFAFNLTSGSFSPWDYSDPVYKYSESGNPAVEATYTDPSDATFKYDVANSNEESRVVPFSKTGAFPLTAFEHNTTVQNKEYRLRVKRESGGVFSSASVQGRFVFEP